MGGPFSRILLSRYVEDIDGPPPASTLWRRVIAPSASVSWLGASAVCLNCRCESCLGRYENTARRAVSEASAWLGPLTQLDPCIQADNNLLMHNSCARTKTTQEHIHTFVNFLLLGRAAPPKYAHQRISPARAVSGRASMMTRAYRVRGGLRMPSL